MDGNPYRVLPSVSGLLAHLPNAPLHGPTLIEFVQRFLDEQRSRIAAGERPHRGQIVARANAELDALSAHRLSPVINATGVVLHTNLGRAPVSAVTAAAIRAAAASYVPLELEPESGRRGGRMSEISALMRSLTGAERTLVVNNNAAAVLLALAALGAGREVIVSRGEAVEIGGGFRIPDVLRQSGAKLVEVGTTNRTYPRDYEAAVTAGTALLLKVHASNFTIEGFTATTSVADLKPVSARTEIPIVEDLGSGNLLDTTAFGLAPEPTIRASIAAGAAVVTASGDKLLGGPQAGIIAGRTDLIERIERHPLARALRADKSCLAGVAATLRHYARDEALVEIPIWRMIAAATDTLDERATAIRDQLGMTGVPAGVLPTWSTIGGGSLPGQRQESRAVGLAMPDLDGLARALRTGRPGVYPRIENGRLLLDLRAVLPEDDDRLVAAVREAVNRAGSRPASSTSANPENRG
jgi:L-seryl-tRNA(Ser) seleniumtransferase